jgi:hypothetical protein
MGKRKRIFESIPPSFAVKTPIDGSQYSPKYSPSSALKTPIIGKPIQSE